MYIILLYVCTYIRTYAHTQTNNELVPFTIQVGPIGRKLDLEVSLVGHFSVAVGLLGSFGLHQHAILRVKVSQRRATN